jgi:hypothetical protein
MGSSVDDRVLDDHNGGRTASPELSVGTAIGPAILSVIVAV